MRKAEKKRASDFVKLLEQAHEQVKKVVEQKNIQDALGILEDCQDGAIVLGSMIERSEGEGTETVSLLEEYCELIYQVHEELVQKTGVNANKMHKMLKQILVKISNSMAREITVRREVVFLPYKASMWDSLESVWHAVDADPACDAYVVPIPYYDKNPDGSFREFHYEGNLYPKDVPVVSYEEYDFEASHPDKIFIHNPYDNYNYVTSVAPFFYSENLKKYTDELIYIPYFVLGEVDPENKAAVEGMAHFVTVPAVMNADKVIVQSENMRRVYIDVMSEYAGEHTRKVWEKKILGLGSPKFDKVANTQMEEEDIPEEWRKIIYKPDGSWKKIILYNTGISALLQHSDKYLTKMRDVFRVFEENKEDVALLWRPHPLIQATISSMRPQLWKDYLSLMEEYRNAGWGIYDDSADLDRAIVISDAYYGDESSVVELCRKKNRLVLLQNCEILYQYISEQDCLWAYNFTIDEEKVWFVPFGYNMLCRLNMNIGKIDFKQKLPVDNQIGIMFSHVIKMNNVLVLIPARTNKVIIFETESNVMTELEMHDYGIDIERFGSYRIYGTDIWFLPFCYPAICKLDIKHKRIKYFTDWYKECGLQKGEYAFGCQNCIAKEYLYIPFSNSNRLLRFDLENEKYCVIKVGKITETFSTIVYHNGHFYLTNQEGDIIICDFDGNEMGRIENTISRRRRDKDCERTIFYVNGILCGNDIYYFPGAADTAVRFHILTSTMEKCSIEKLDVYKKYIKRWGYWFSNVIHRDEYLYGFDIIKQNFFKKNIETGEIECFYLSSEQILTEKRALYFQMVKEGNVIEDFLQYDRLDTFIKEIVQSEEKV